MAKPFLPNHYKNLEEGHVVHSPSTTGLTEMLDQVALCLLKYWVVMWFITTKSMQGIPIGPSLFFTNSMNITERKWHLLLGKEANRAWRCKLQEAERYRRNDEESVVQCFASHRSAQRMTHLLFRVPLRLWLYFYSLFPKWHTENFMTE